MAKGGPFATVQAGSADDQYRDPVREAFRQFLLAKQLQGRPGTTEALYVLHFGSMERPDVLVNGGVVVLETCRVFGGDGGYYWIGSYRLHGQTLKVEATVERHNPTWSVWGDRATRFEVRFTGQRRDDGAVIEGELRRLDMPDKPVIMKWFRMADLP